MTKRMLIDAVHAEETRVVVVDGQRIEELDFESQSRKQLRGNIYLAKVTRVEPSLQAAFIEYGGNRHGFLAFNEIHPDYYQIPVADREALLREEAEDEEEPVQAHVGEDGESVSDDEDDVMEEELERRRRRLMRRYKIQEVIRRRQIMLVQVVKEERGNKGAALTTYLSLAGRYCVLMPNTARGGGISRKITNAPDRKRLKSMAQGLDVPHGMGLIIRTAGAKRTKVEIKRDYEYLLRMWEVIRETTLQSIAPALIYAEEDLVKRAIRDMYDKDLDGILVEGEAGYREARDFMRMLMPSQAKKIQLYKDPTPLFVRHRIEDQLAQIHSPVVPLRSGGYIVINQTEALVAVDVNSGKATRERNVEATALKTNLEAAEEAARQLRLRDLAGLIVIDFIDMEESKNNRAVEKVLKDCLSDDRARVQLGKISPFGLMEISRQRRRSGVLEGTTHVCEHCQGTGRVRSVESSALAALRAMETEFARGGAGAVTVRLPTAVALYVLNEKRAYLAQLELFRDLTITIITDEALAHADIGVERTESREGAILQEIESQALPVISFAEDADDEDDLEEDGFEEDEADGGDEVEDGQADLQTAAAARTGRASEDAGPLDESQRRRRRRRRGRRDEEGDRGARTDLGVRTDDSGAADLDAVGPEPAFDGQADDAYGAAADTDSEAHRRRRRRGRRGGRRVREEPRSTDPYAWVHAHGGDDAVSSLDDPYTWRDPHAPGASPQDRALEAEADRMLAPDRSPQVSPQRSAPKSPDGLQAEAESGVDPYRWREPGDEDETAIEGRRERSRRGRGRRGRGRPRTAGGYAESSDAGGVGLETGSQELHPDAGSSLDQGEARGSEHSAESSAPETSIHGSSARPISAPEGTSALEPIPMSALDSHATDDDETVADAPDDDASPAADSGPPADAITGSNHDHQGIAAQAAEPPPPPEPDPSEISSPPEAPRRGWWRRR